MPVAASLAALAFGLTRRRQTCPLWKLSRLCCALRRRFPTPTPRAVGRSAQVLRPRSDRDRQSGRRVGAKAVTAPGSQRVVMAIVKGEAAIGITFKKLHRHHGRPEVRRHPAASSGRPGAVHRRGAEECKRARHRPGIVASLTTTAAAAVWTSAGLPCRRRIDRDRNVARPRSAADAARLRQGGDRISAMMSADGPSRRFAATPQYVCSWG